MLAARRQEARVEAKGMEKGRRESKTSSASTAATGRTELCQLPASMASLPGSDAGRDAAPRRGEQTVYYSSYGSEQCDLQDEIPGLSADAILTERPFELEPLRESEEEDEEPDEAKFQYLRDYDPESLGAALDSCRNGFHLDSALDCGIPYFADDADDATTCAVVEDTLLSEVLDAVGAFDAYSLGIRDCSFFPPQRGAGPAPAAAKQHPDDATDAPKSIAVYRRMLHGEPRGAAIRQLLVAALSPPASGEAAPCVVPAPLVGSPGAALRRLTRGRS